MSKFASGSMCYTLEQKCDGFTHCLNGRDEEECSMLIRSAELHTVKFAFLLIFSLHFNNQGKFHFICYRHLWCLILRVFYIAISVADGIQCVKILWIGPLKHVNRKWMNFLSNYSTTHSQICFHLQRTKLMIILNVSTDYQRFKPKLGDILVHLFRKFLKTYNFHRNKFDFPTNVQRIQKVVLKCTYG